MSGRIRRLRPDEAAAAARRAAVSFGSTFDDAAVEVWRERIDAGEVWGAVGDDDTVLAHARLSAVDHWFGGRRVPTQHVAAVAVPPEHRGRGVATALLAAAVDAGVAEGLGLSLLFPATTRLYRRLDWEHAGTFTRYRVDARVAPAGGPRMRPAADTDWAAIRACHQRAAQALQGPAVRSERRWLHLRASTYRYVLDDAGGAGEVEAYLLFDHDRRPGDWQYTLVIADWAATSARALRAVVALVGSHGSLGRDATFRGPLPETWSLLLDEQDVQVAGGMFWMARGLDLPAAIAARGFPPGLSGSVTVRVDDPLVAAAAGPWRLEVAAGQGALVPARHADVRLLARAVGPLYTGFRSPQALALAGLVDGPSEALAWLAGAFAGPLPVLLDFF